jgi:hypothetical protein
VAFLPPESADRLYYLASSPGLGPKTAVAGNHDCRMRLSLCPMVDRGGAATCGKPVMPLDAYQQRASECLRLAESSVTIEERATWRELALCWLRLSERAGEFRSPVQPVE